MSVLLGLASQASAKTLPIVIYGEAIELGVEPVRRNAMNKGKDCLK